jgi:hypothetical protein
LEDESDYVAVVTEIIYISRPLNNQQMNKHFETVRALFISFLTNDEITFILDSSIISILSSPEVQ